MLLNLLCNGKDAWNKVLKTKDTKWKDLSFGEKIFRVLLYIVKIVLFAAVGVVFLGIVLSIWAAVGIMSGISGAIYGEIGRSKRHYNRW